MQEELDTSNGVLFPLYDEDTGLLYLAGKVLYSFRTQVKVESIFLRQIINKSKCNCWWRIYLIASLLDYWLRSISMPWILRMLCLTASNIIDSILSTNRSYCLSSGLYWLSLIFLSLCNALAKISNRVNRQPNQKQVVITYLHLCSDSVINSGH